MMKTIIAIIFAALPLALSAQMFPGFPASQQDLNNPDIQLHKFDQFFRNLSRSYVDSIAYDQLIETAITEVLAKLDPHSTYVSVEEMKAVSEQFEGNFSGIGIEFNVFNDTIQVVNTIAGGPSEKVGLLPNDRIVGIDGESAIGMTRADAPKKLRGPKGTEVFLDVARRGMPEVLKFRIVRDDIPITTIDAAYKIDDTTAYLKVNRFAQNTMPEFYETLVKLGKVESIILDLRGNGGGLLDQGVMMSGFFLPKGAEIVSMDGMRIDKEDFKNPLNGAFMSGRLIILVDDYSASASEIVAGAVQDWDRGVVIGRRTFGKGLVQRQYSLLDGSAVRITVAKYFTPTGRAIQRPYEKGMKDDYYQSYVQQLNAEDESQVGDTLQVYKTLKLGKTVYGGGGIYPDIYVHRDTTEYTRYWGELVMRGVMAEYVADYMDRNRTTLERAYPDLGSFSNDFNADEIVTGLSELGVKREVPVNEEQFAVSRRRMALQLKALIAQRLFGTSAYFEVINPEADEIYKKAVEVLDNWNSETRRIVAD